MASGHSKGALDKPSLLLASLPPTRHWSPGGPPPSWWCIFLIKRGTQEAAGARALQRIASEIKAIRQQLLDACEKHDIATVTRKTLQVHDRRHAYELKYATAVREYQKPQGYLYQDFRQHAKYFKCAVLPGTCPAIVTFLVYPGRVSST